jgi:hypothetical protein
MVSDENNFYISLQYNPLLNLLCSGDHLGIKTRQTYRMKTMSPPNIDA